MKKNSLVFIIDSSGFRDLAKKQEIINMVRTLLNNDMLVYCPQLMWDEYCHISKGHPGKVINHNVRMLEKSDYVIINEVSTTPCKRYLAKAKELNLGLITIEGGEVKIEEGNAIQRR